MSGFAGSTSPLAEVCTSPLTSAGSTVSTAAGALPEEQPTTGPNSSSAAVSATPCLVLTAASLVPTTYQIVRTVSPERPAPAVPVDPSG
ncbi:hypothetical protein GCM10009664_68380 [Kitasatospora gansuensis]